MLSIIKREIQTVEGIAVTTFPIPERVNTLLKTLGLTNSVKFLSRNVDLDIPGLIKSASLYVSTALSPIGAIDPPLTLIEAMILGTPVLAYDSGGIDEILDEDRLVKFNDYDGLAKLAIESLRRNEPSRPRPELLSKFGSKPAAEHFEEIYQSLT